VEEVALYLHLLGAFVFLAGLVLAGAAFETARRRAARSEVALLLGLARGGALLAVAGAAVLAPFGLWLVHLGGFGYGSGWVDAAIATFLASLALGAYGGQAPKRARRLATAAGAGGEALESELRAALDDPRARAANYLALAFVLATITLMVFK
jgi:uncharacterized membrane protein